MPTRADEQTWTIAQVADEFGITHRTVRHYEDLGLISPERHGTKRLYRRRDRTRLQLILRGKRLGFPLDRSARSSTSTTHRGANAASCSTSWTRSTTDAPTSSSDAAISTMP